LTQVFVMIIAPSRRFSKFLHFETLLGLQTASPMRKFFLTRLWPLYT